MADFDPVFLVSWITLSMTRTLFTSVGEVDAALTELDPAKAALDFKATDNVVICAVPVDGPNRLADTVTILAACGPSADISQIGLSGVPNAFVGSLTFSWYTPAVTMMAVPAVALLTAAWIVFNGLASEPVPEALPVVETHMNFCGVRPSKRMFSIVRLSNKTVGLLCRHRI